MEMEGAGRAQPVGTGSASSDSFSLMYWIALHSSLPLRGLVLPLGVCCVSQQCPWVLDASLLCLWDAAPTQSLQTFSGRVNISSIEMDCAE